jgi:hypothetical protein
MHTASVEIRLSTGKLRRTIMRKYIFILIAITMTMFVATAYAFEESEVEMSGCKKSIAISGKLLHVQKTCDVKFDESEALSICSYCVDKYKIRDDEVFDLGAVGRILFNHEVREKGKFRACKDMVETFPKLFSY